MTSPENKEINELSKRRINPNLADGEDSQGLYYVDRWGRRWHHVDHIDGYSGRIVFYRNKGNGSVLSYETEMRIRRAKQQIAGKAADREGIESEKGLGTTTLVELKTVRESAEGNDGINPI